MGNRTRLLAIAIISGIGGCAIDSQDMVTTSESATTVTQLLGANTESSDWFGYSVAISADGSTLAVGAVGEDGGARGVNQPDINHWWTEAGAVYVFVRVDGAWVQEAYVKPSNTSNRAWFGSSVALSADGSTLAVGSVQESSPGTGINGDQTQGYLLGSGAAYIFVRDAGTWTQQAYFKAHRVLGANFGHRVALSADGSTFAVSAPADWGPDLFNGDHDRWGSVYVFARTGVTWSPEAYLQAEAPDYYDQLGHGLALSSDGSTLLASAPGEAGGFTGLQGNQHDDTKQGSGAAYLFVRANQRWRQRLYVKASNADAGDGFGAGNVALAPDGTSFAVAASGERSSANTVNGDQTDNSQPYAGAVYLFGLAGGRWLQQAYIKASDTRADNLFGYDVALSASSLFVSANGWTSYDATPGYGSAYVFSTSGTPAQTEVLASPAPTDRNQFGRSIAINANGSLRTVGAPFEAATGHAYVFSD